MAGAVGIDELAEVLSSAPFARAYGFRILSADAGGCSLEVPIRPEFERPGGIMAGVVYVAAADVAFWLAIIAHLGREAEMAVTSEMTTAFLAAARGEAFVCTARVLKAGRRLIYGVAECTDRENRLLAHHTLTYVRP